jgi:hypothetical protein
VEFSQVADGDLTPLMTLANLREATLGEVLRGLAQQALAGAKFTVKYRQY